MSKIQSGDKIRVTSQWSTFYNDELTVDFVDGDFVLVKIPYLDDDDVRAFGKHEVEITATTSNCD